MNWRLFVVGVVVLAVGVVLGGIVGTSSFTVTDLRVVDDGADESPLVYDATLTEATVSPGDPATIRFSVTNSGSKPVTIESGPLPPFGLITATPTETDVHGIVAKSELMAARQGGFVLWRDAYEESNEVTLHGGGGSVAAEEYHTTLQPGETITQTFKIRSNATGLTQGTYRIRQRQSWDSGEHLVDPSEVRYVVTFDVRGTNATQ